MFEVALTDSNRSEGSRGVCPMDEPTPKRTSLVFLSLLVSSSDIVSALDIRGTCSIPRHHLAQLGLKSHSHILPKKAPLRGALGGGVWEGEIL